MKLLYVLVLLNSFLPNRLVGQPTEFAKRKANLLARQAQDVFVLYEAEPNTTASPAWKKPSAVTHAEIDMVLRKELRDWYSSGDSTVLYFVNWWLKQPDQYVRIWLGLADNLKQQLSTLNDNRLFVLALSHLQLLPGLNEHPTYRGIWAIHPHVATLFKLIVNNYVDEREQPDKCLSAAQAYLQELMKRHGRADVALLAYFNGSPAIQRALLRASSGASIGEILPYLPESTRYAYSFFCATTYVWSKRSEWKANPVGLMQKGPKAPIELEQEVDLAQVARLTGRGEHELFSMNANYIQRRVPAGAVFHVYSADKKVLMHQKDSLFLQSKPQKSVQQTDTCLVYYRTKSGDYYRDLTRWFGVSMATVQADNGLTGTKLKIGVDLFFRVPCADSLHFATFDGLSRTEKDLLAEGKMRGDTVPNQQEIKPVQVSKPKEVSPAGKGTKITYVVKSGDTLWAIGQRYKVKDTDIMRWNNVGAKIQPGQKLIIYLP